MVSRLAERPFNETRCCHHESSLDSKFIIDRRPEPADGFRLEPEGFEEDPGEE